MRVASLALVLAVVAACRTATSQAPSPSATPSAPLAPAASVPSPADAARPAETEADVKRIADGWRARHLLIDLHEHVDDTPEHLAQAVRIQDAVGVGVAVNLSGGTVTPGADGAS